MKRNFLIIIIVIIIAVIFAFVNYSSKNGNYHDHKKINTEGVYTTADVSNLRNTNNFLPSAIKHIFFGTVKDGKAEGFHYANIKNSSSYIIAGTESTPNSFGVFKAKAEIDGKLKSDDNGYSTFFPNSMSPQKVVDSINEAYSNAKNIHGNIYIGKTKNGMEIEIYLSSDGKIISAFPKY
ncbi:EndoU domain-containing protein [Clostridium sp.]|uniref:EndoU domain-containing protein n=1 Tax=Clostridium sp. TaxID=1506 RepID=UPI0039913D3D